LASTGLPWGISILPLKVAPSDIVMRGALRLPSTTPPAFSSKRSFAVTLPITWPSTTTDLATISAVSLALAPTVSTLSGRLMRPSTLPSSVRSSAPLRSPLMAID
jgi:hypothetical protein